MSTSIPRSLDCSNAACLQSNRRCAYLIDAYRQSFGSADQAMQAMRNQRGNLGLQSGGRGKAKKQRW